MGFPVKEVQASRSKFKPNFASPMPARSVQKS